MKATGIVRRIDDLGRVVIPKEIRRTMRIRVTDPLEIFTNEMGEIVLHKYSPIGEMEHFAKEYAESLAQTTGQMVCICDKERFIAATGNAKRLLIGKNISEQLEHFLEDRMPLCAHPTEADYILVSNESDMVYYAQAICPIICAGDVLGAVLMLAKDTKTKYSEAQKMLVSVAADFLAKQMENE